MINVLLADDHQLVTEGLRSLLQKEPTVRVVGEVHTGREVIEVLEHELVDIVVLDIEMPEMDGIEATKIIRQRFPRTKVLILSSYHRRDFVLQLIQLGINGYILKNRSVDELIGAIHQVYQGHLHLSLEIGDLLAQAPRYQPQEVELTEREKEVLMLTGEALSAKQIADRLCISETTVNTHWRNLRSKLELPSLAALVRYAIRHGYNQTE